MRDTHWKLPIEFSHAMSPHEPGSRHSFTSEGGVGRAGGREGETASVMREDGAEITGDAE